MNNKLLADIGNSFIHIYDGQNIEHLSYQEAFDKYKDNHIQYISVKSQLESEIKQITAWENISSYMTIKGEYETMGIDRKALCLSHEEGVFIDVGSAITLDVVQNSTYCGGFILPGLKAFVQSYKDISPALDIDLNYSVALEKLPTTTKDGISYGIIASIKALIDKHSNRHTLYFTGGDGKFLSTFFENAIYDEMLVFNGMQRAIENKG